MNRSQLNGNTYSGPQFGDSLRIYELEEEKIIRRRRHYKYGIALILLVGCIYLMMDVMQIGYKEPLMDKETVNKVKKYVNEASPLLNKPRSCQDHFKADFVEHGTDEYQEVDLNFGDMCLTNSTLPDPEFAIAFVFDNYFNFKMLDSVLNLLYHKKHLYCIISNNNKMNSQDLANLYKMDQCLPNVFVVTKREEVDGHGLECLNLIRNKPWNYTILLDNEDVPIKRITQFPSILKLLNGSSDMNIKEVRQVNANILDHFTYDKLDIFKNESLNKLSNVSCQVSINTTILSSSITSTNKTIALLHTDVPTNTAVLSSITDSSDSGNSFNTSNTITTSQLNTSGNDTTTAPQFVVIGHGTTTESSMSVSGIDNSTSSVNTYTNRTNIDFEVNTTTAVPNNITDKGSAFTQFRRSDRLKLYGSESTITLARKDVEYFFDHINSTKLLCYLFALKVTTNFNLFWPTLLVNRPLGFPSVIEHKCQGFKSTQSKLTNRLCRSFKKSYNYCDHVSGSLQQIPN